MIEDFDVLMQVARSNIQKKPIWEPCPECPYCMHWSWKSCDICKFTQVICISDERCIKHNHHCQDLDADLSVCCDTKSKRRPPPFINRNRSLGWEKKKSDEHHNALIEEFSLLYIAQELCNRKISLGVNEEIYSREYNYIYLKNCNRISINIPSKIKYENISKIFDECLTVLEKHEDYIKCECYI